MFCARILGRSGAKDKVGGCGMSEKVEAEIRLRKMHFDRARNPSDSKAMRRRMMMKAMRLRKCEQKIHIPRRHRLLPFSADLSSKQTKRVKSHPRRHSVILLKILSLLKKLWIHLSLKL